jgi:hypothetical protein
LINTEYLLTVIAQEELIRTNLTCRDLLDEAKVYIFKKANLLTTKSPMGPKIIPRKTAAGIFIDKKKVSSPIVFPRCFIMCGWSWCDRRSI